MTKPYNTPGAAALSICESLLIALNDLNVIGDREARAVLEDAAATHRNAMASSSNPEEHRATAELIERIRDGKNSVRAMRDAPFGPKNNRS